MWFTPNCIKCGRPLMSHQVCMFCVGGDRPTEIEIKAPPKKDAVNPDHYNGTECLDAIAIATKELTGYEAFCTGNAIKYLWRWKQKGGVEDLNKAIRYIELLKKLVSDVHGVKG